LKAFSKSLVAAALVSSALVSQTAMAAQKIGVVNIQGVFQALPQAAAIQTTLDTEFKDKIDQVKKLEGDIKFELEKLQREKATMSEAQVKELQDKVVNLRKEYEAKVQPLQQGVQRRQVEERDKLLALIKQSIDSIAAKDKYDVILNSGSVAFIDDAFDVSKQVIDQVSKIK